MGSTSRVKLALAFGGAFASLSALAACSTAPAPVATPRLAASTPPLARTGPASSPSVTSNPSFLRDPEAAPWGVRLIPGETLVGNYTNYIYPVQVPTDSGSIKYARGTPIEEGARVVAYRVASGDIYDYIAERFHLTDDGYLLVLNEPRRGEAAQLYAGDVLNLSASTLHKYGTVNGRVVHGPEPVTAPSQEP